jgi:hypothetical protein
MVRRSLRCDWTENDRLTRAKWMRGMAVFYGCIALLLLGAIALMKPSNLAPDGSADRQTWAAGFQGERGRQIVDRGHHREVARDLNRLKIRLRCGERCD